MISLHFYLYIFTIAVAVAAIVGIFRSNLFNQLSTRIAALILAAGPITFILFRVADKLIINGPPRRASYLAMLVAYVLIILGAPAVLGWLAVRFIRRPLRQFNEAIASLEHSNYKVQLQPTGIQEFDEVFTKFNDLTNRLKHEEKLRKDLVSDTSHELNTPLATMIGQLTAMQEGKLPITKERVTVLKEQADRLAGLAQQLDAYTKARIPDRSQSEHIYLQQFCKQLIGQFEVDLKHAGITAKLDIADDITVDAHRDALHSILTNLIQNTLRYSEATALTISASAKELTFSDNGKGVPSSSLPYLFERFYRADASRSRETGGLGLGLAIVKELAESHGWAIAVTAGRPGLVFIIKINPVY